MEIHAEEKISVKEGNANVLVSPKGVRLLNIVNDVDDLLAEAEKQLLGKVKRLSGKIEAKSEFLGDLIAEKKKKG